jgi:glutaminyl-tRNA synthetase
MKNGKYLDNEAVLRLKIDMQNNNHSLRDPIAYRIKHISHHRTGKEWCIYPSYDYSHGLVDAFEGITDSFCTMEFYVRRDQYYWPVLKLKEKFNLVAANVFEFGRLNIEGIELSKRKIIPLIKQNIVSGFDDPRLYTIRGLRRRGFTPEILKKIVSHAGMGRSETIIERSLIDHELRNVLDRDSIRAFAVLNPLKIKILNNDMSEKSCDIIEKNHQNHPTDISKGSHNTDLSPNIFIEKTDFRAIDSVDFYRLAPNKTIRLRYADFVEYVSHTMDNVIVKDIIPEKPKKIKGVIHWVSKERSKRIIIQIYDDLYDVVEGIDKNIKMNLNSKIMCYDSLVENYVIEYLESQIDKINIVFQFERLGYFKFDHYSKHSDSSEKIPVFMRVIDLTDKYNK